MAMPKKVDPQKTCAYCGKALERKRINGRLEDRVIFLRRKYCNRLCMAQAFVKQEVTLAALHWRANKLKRSSCEMCPATENLDVHHKDGNPENNELENVMTLCDSCHAKWHWTHGKQPWKKKSACRVCGQPARKLGMCQKHYQRYRKYGDPLLAKKRRGSDYELVREVPGRQSGPEFQESSPDSPDGWTDLDASETP